MHRRGPRAGDAQYAHVRFERMKHWGVGLVVLLSACTINGKKYGPGSSSNDSSSGGGSSSSSGGGGGGGANQEPSKPYDFNADAAAYPTAPADPWAGVNGDQ